MVAVELGGFGVGVWDHERGDWVQAEGLADDGVEVGEVGDVGLLGHPCGADDGVQLGLEVGLDVWMVQKLC